MPIMPRSLAPSPTAIASASGQAEFGGDGFERLDLRLAAEDRPLDFAGEAAVGDDEPVGAVLVEAEALGDDRGEGGEAAGDERGARAVRPHRRDELAVRPRRA